MKFFNIRFAVLRLFFSCILAYISFHSINLFAAAPVLTCNAVDGILTTIKPQGCNKLLFNDLKKSCFGDTNANLDKYNYLVTDKASMLPCVSREATGATDKFIEGNKPGACVFNMMAVDKTDPTASTILRVFLLTGASAACNSATTSVPLGGVSVQLPTTGVSTASTSTSTSVIESDSTVPVILSNPVSSTGGVRDL
jgi:hypothetical protein